MFYPRFSKFAIMVLLLFNWASTTWAATVVFAQTSNGLIYKSTDSAKTWQPAGLPFTTNFVTTAALAVDPQNTNNLYSIYIFGIKGNPVSGAPGENLFQMDNSGNIVARAVNLGPDTDQVFLILYGTGFRAAGTANTSVTIGGQPAQVSFAGPQGAFAGLDQMNILLPRSLAGGGTANIVLTASGQAANTVNISVE